MANLQISIVLFANNYVGDLYLMFIWHNSCICTYVRTFVITYVLVISYSLGWMHICCHFITLSLPGCVLLDAV